MCRHDYHHSHDPPPRGHHPSPHEPLRRPGRRPLRLPPYLPGPGLLPPGPPHHPQDLPLASRRSRLALGDPDRPQPRHPPGPESHHPRAGRRGVAASRPGRRHPHPLGRPLQALGPARIRAGPAHEAPARPRAPEAPRGHPQRRPGPRRPPRGRGCGRLDGPKRRPAPAGHLSPRRLALRGPRQPDRGPHPPGGQGPPRPGRPTLRGEGPDRGRPRGRPGGVGHRPLRRPAPRRAGGPALVGRRPRARGHPRRAQLGPEGGSRRAEEPLGA